MEGNEVRGEGGGVWVGAGVLVGGGPVDGRCAHLNVSRPLHGFQWIVRGPGWDGVGIGQLIRQLSLRQAPRLPIGETERGSGNASP